LGLQLLLQSVWDLTCCWTECRLDQRSSRYGHGDS